MRRWITDFVDQLCIEWAVERRKMLGIVLPKMLEPRERLGKIRSTLGAVKDEGEGASYSAASQNWPEVYTGDNLLVHRAWHGMNGDWKLVMHTHYVWQEVPVVLRIRAVGCGFRTYYSRLALLKESVDNYVKVHKKHDATE